MRRAKIETSEGWLLVRCDAPDPSEGYLGGAGHATGVGAVEGANEPWEGDVVFFDRAGARGVPGDPRAWFVPVAAVMGRVPGGN